MNLLLDTHALIWFINGDDQFRKSRSSSLKSLIISALLVLFQFGRSQLNFLWASLICMVDLMRFPEY